MFIVVQRDLKGLGSFGVRCVVLDNKMLTGGLQSRRDEEMGCFSMPEDHRDRNDTKDQKRTCININTALFQFGEVTDFRFLLSDRSQSTNSAHHRYPHTSCLKAGLTVEG